MKTRPSLFDVLSKAPQTDPSPTSGRRGWWRLRAKDEESAPVVAEPLTEAQAEAELIADQEAKEKAARERDEAARVKRERREARRREREERRAVRATAKAAARRARAAARQAAPRGKDEVGLPPRIQFANGRLLVSLNTAACIGVGAIVCILALGAYSLGRRTAGSPPNDMLAAVKPASGEAGQGVEDLLFPGNAGASDPSVNMGREETRNPDLSALLSKPPSLQEPEVKANQPARVSGGGPATGAEASKLNYLQIETFRLSREKSSEALLDELADVRRFLRERGIETFARRNPNGFRLYAAEGFPTSAEFKAKREAFRRRMEALGREYRRSGGLYLFKGCFFVTYERAMSGQPS